MENLVGRKIRGFEFEGANFNSKMKKYIGEIGVIESYFENKVRVEFESDVWYYPLDQIEQHLIPLEVFKLGQKVWDMSISDEAGVVIRIDGFGRYKITVLFIKDKKFGYSLEGINEHGQKTLSTTPYTFQGFSQETIIERGTLVYYRNYESNNWNIGFYSHIEEGKHHCFVDQVKEGSSLHWKYCQTQNPLI